MNFKKGFTLIELLVVVSIISLLASIVLSALGTARSKARDAKRKQDIHSILLAMQIYYNGHGAFPFADYNSACGTALTGVDSTSSALINDNDIGSMPTVPSNSGTCGDNYYAGTNTSTFSAGSCLTNQCVAVLTKLENVDSTNCISALNWYSSGSYCDGKYIQTIPQ